MLDARSVAVPVLQYSCVDIRAALIADTDIGAAAVSRVAALVAVRAGLDREDVGVDDFALPCLHVHAVYPACIACYFVHCVTSLKRLRGHKSP